MFYGPAFAGPIYRAWVYKLRFDELIQIRKFAISNLRSRRIFTLISLGTIRFLRGTI